MEGSEIPVFILSLVLAADSWRRWYLGGRRPSWAGATGQAVMLGLAPLACFSGLFLVLRHLAAADVCNAPVYLLFYEVMGAAWIGAATYLMGWWGLSMRDDAVERRNPAAGLALVGALGGVTLCFAGANVGNGPGWWVVAFAAALATAGLMLAWLLVESGHGVGETITIDRDRTTGLRFGCFLTASGLILGRAVAGDWVSAAQTVDDFGRLAWPVLVLITIEIVIGLSSRPKPRRPETPLMEAGILPSMVYLGGAFWYVWTRGWW